MKTHMVRQFLPRPQVAQVVGGSYNQLIRTLGYWSAINSIIILVLGWDSSIGSFLRGLFPWMTFQWFLVLVVGGAITVAMIDLVFILPSVYAFGNRQATVNDNPVYDKLIDVENEVIALKEELEKWKKANSTTPITESKDTSTITGIPTSSPK